MAGRIGLLVALASLGLCGETLMADGNATIRQLRCEYLINPLGIDAAKPRLSWIVESDRRGWMQSAYHVLVATSPSLLEPGKADLWDSGKVASDQSTQVACAGKPLASRMRCWWKVQVWDETGKPLGWSETASWSMGLLKPEDWTAQWIGADWFKKNVGRLPWLRKTFTLDENPEYAAVTVNAIGYYELYVNGKKVDESVLTPAVSAYAKRSLYLTHDVTGYLTKGKNCIGLWLGRGWESRLLAQATQDGPVVRAELDVTLPGGKSKRMVTDGSWRVHPSPILPLGAGHTGDYGGEQYDAGQDVPNWNGVDLDDSQWQPAKVCNPTTQQAVAQDCRPNRIFETIKPVTIEAVADGAFVVDMGRNFSGWIDIRFPPGQAGQKVVLEYADKRFPDGKLQTYHQRDEYIMRGGGEEAFRSRFNYHAFRWVKLAGLGKKPELGDIKGYMIHTGYAPAAAFECSNDLLNRIHATTVWTYRCLSLGGYVVDCPTRERLGYGGDSGASLETGMTNFDLGAFFTKWLADWRADQDASGDLPHTSPHPGPAGGGPAWGGVIVALPWQVYVQYGDKRILEETYPAIRKWIAFLETKVKDGLLQHYIGIGCPTAQWNFLGDWVPPGRDQGGNRVDDHSTLFFNNCYMLYNLRLAAKTAAVLGKADEAVAYEKRADALARLLHERFLNKDGVSYANGEQPYLAMPLLFGVTPADLRGKVMDSLEKAIRVTNKGHLNTGMHGTYYMLKVLIAQGRNDLIFEIASKDTYPSWGYMLANGATTIWEEWKGDNSHIHNTLVSIGAWFIQGLGGIRYDESAPGFKHFVARPGVVGDLTFVHSKYDSMHGTIVSNWKRDGDRLIFEVTVPPNTTATVMLPAKSVEAATESDRPLTGRDDVKAVRAGDGLVRATIGSGSYRFVVR